MPTKDELDLAQLADSYDILGELSGRPDARVALATRKADGFPVLITVIPEPQADEGNALSHLASDAKLLEEHSHPAIVRVIESRWIGGNLAMVTDRVSAPSLAERLSRRDEEFPFPRIATLLREVNSALAWARERGIVHRSLRPDLLFLEEGSDRLQLMFSAEALSGNGTPDEHDDARTIAALARAMLTRSVADPDRDKLPLAELRPGLPARVVQQTEALLGRAESLEPVDVRAYIAAIAMSEELKQGEEEWKRVTREMSEEQRIMREQLAAERKAHEEDLAEQARKFEKERDAILKAMAKEREEAARALARERDEGEKTLRQERERLEKEIRKQRALLEKAQGKLAREREAFERERAKAREQIAAKLEALRVQAELYSRTSELPAVLEEPFLEREPAVTEVESDVDADTLPGGVPQPHDAVPAVSVEDQPEAVPPQPKRSDRPTPRLAPAWRSRSPGSRRARTLGLAAAVLVLAIAITALALGRRDSSAAAERASGQPPISLRVIDSLGGISASRVATDSTLPPTDSAAAEPPVRRARAPRQARAEPAPVRDTMLVSGDTTASAAAVFPASLPFTRDSARKDTLPRRDTTLPRDSVRRDTLSTAGIDR